MDDDGVQFALSVVGGACERRSRQRGEAGLDADGVLVDVEEAVGRLQVDGRLRAVTTAMSVLPPETMERKRSFSMAWRTTAATSAAVLCRSPAYWS